MSTVQLTLPSLAPSIVLEILPQGVTVHRIFIQADGRTHDIAIGPEDPLDHRTQKYTNTIIGRFANRLPVGTHTISKHGIISEVTAIANESPVVSLHGGPVGFDYVPWTILPSPEEATLFTPAELAEIPSTADSTSSALFRLVSPHGDQGFPGTLTIEVLVALVGPKLAPRDNRRFSVNARHVPSESSESQEADLGSVVFVYRAKVVGENGAPVVTPINITQHWGFNLDASLAHQEHKEAGSSSAPPNTLIKGHTLKLAAINTAELDPISHLATGNLLPVAGTAHEHTGEKPLGDYWPEGDYDHFYQFPEPASRVTHIPISEFDSTNLLKGLFVEGTAAGNPNPKAILASTKSGIKLAFDSNQNGVMFYSNIGADPAGARKKIHGGTGLKGDGYVASTAAFLEFHDPLAAFLRGDKDTLLASDEIYHNYVRMDVRHKSVA